MTSDGAPSYRMTSEVRSLIAYSKGDITFDQNHYVRRGGFGDLFRGQHSENGVLALKRLRLGARGMAASDQKRDALLEEAMMWQDLSHTNVLAFWGIYIDSHENAYLVSPWAENGSLIEYIAEHPAADRTALLRDAAEGLAYLHREGIVHGDLKGANALVTSELRVVLCDFGLSKMAETLNSSTGGKGTTQWQSPELLMGGARTFEADIYAFGIMIYEIISGRRPFAEHASLASVAMAVVQRNERRPTQPRKSAEGQPYAAHWRIAESCWAQEPKKVHL